jgi:hypothetical protein
MGLIKMNYWCKSVKMGLMTGVNVNICDYSLQWLIE